MGINGIQICDGLVPLQARGILWLQRSLGFCVAVDAISRLPDSHSFYGAEGILPLEAWKSLSLPWLWSVEFLCAEDWQLFLLRGIHFLCGIWMLFAKRPFLPALASWFFTSSVQARNPLVNLGGDYVLRLALLWAASLFFSIHTSRAKAAVLHGAIARFCLGLQVAAIYWICVLHRDSAAWWYDGTALEEALQLRVVHSGLGDFLLGFPDLTQAFTRLITVLEVIGPFALFLPGSWWRWRRGVALIFSILHLLIAVILNLPQFSLSMIAIWSPFFFGGDAHERAESKISDGSITKTACPLVVSWLGLAFSVLLAALFFRTAIEQFDSKPQQALALRAPGSALARFFRLDQSWWLFAPKPWTDDVWLEVQFCDTGYGEKRISIGGVLPPPGGVRQEHYALNNRWQRLIYHLHEQGLPRVRESLARLILQGGVYSPLRDLNSLASPPRISEIALVSRAVKALTVEKETKDVLLGAKCDSRQ